MLGAGPGNVCKDCHDQYGKPECNETAQHFHDQIDRLEGERDAARGDVAAEERGLDLADVRFSLLGVDDVLVESRSKIHSFSRADFDKAPGRGSTAPTRARPRPRRAGSTAAARSASPFRR